MNNNAKTPKDILEAHAKACRDALEAGLPRPTLPEDQRDFSETFLMGADLRGADLKFIDLSGSDLREADLQGADIKWADLLEADLWEADLRGADIKWAYLGEVDFSGADLRKADLQGADFSRADLREADLQGADFSGADLREADLRGAYLRGATLSHYIPSVHNLHTKILAAINAGGKLDMKEWHTCATTHCRAGWAIHLAGEKGYRLERNFGSAVAGALIHIRSCPWMEQVPDFYTTNADAMADIQACAEKEKEVQNDR